MMSISRAGRDGSTQSVGWVAAGAILLVATAWEMPSLLPVLLGVALAFGVLVLAYRHLTLAWVAWVLVAGLSIEMALADLIGPQVFQPTIAAVKGAEIGLVALMILRYGIQLDWLNPAWAFVGMAAMGAVMGTHPDLSTMDMLRSLVGSVVPFLLFFCRKPRGWGARVRRAICFAPLLSVVLGAALDIAGMRPSTFESGGLRLAGLGHPAFLAGVCLPAIYAGLLRWLRTASPRAAMLLGVNLIILFLTGARAPAAYAAIVIGGSLLLAPDAAVPRAHRLALFAAGLAAVPILLVVGENYSSFRLFEVLSGEPGQLSGRDLLWPAFEAAAAKAPWFGWGIGSGNLVIPHDGPIALLLRTWAAHNEYLRIQVEGGYVGRTLLIVLFVLWATTHTRRLPPLERVVMRLIFLTYAAHAMTDNVLISTPACVFFAFIAAVLAEAEDAAAGRLRDTLDVA
jgi:O-antigen ligase